MGALRLFLALSVIVQHAGATVLGFHGVNGAYAVNIFFIISGFYMAMVLNEKYRDVEPYIFYESRLLRLFPVYLIGLIFVLIISHGHKLAILKSLELPNKILYLLTNAFIFGQDAFVVACIENRTGKCLAPQAMLNMPTWTLSVELGFYFVAPFIVKNIERIFAFVIFGSAYLLSLNMLDGNQLKVSWLNSGFSESLNYYFYPSSFIFFGGGALAYHLSKDKNGITFKAYLLVIIIMFVLQFANMNIWPKEYFFCCLMIPVIFKATKNLSYDRFIGELSYPVYIFHWPIIGAIQKFNKQLHGVVDAVGLGNLVALVSCTIGVILYYFVERRVDKYRHSRHFLRQGQIAVKSNFFIQSFKYFYFVFFTVYFVLPVCFMFILFSSR